MVGATIMAHGDDAGLVLPPNVAPRQLVIVPIFRNEDARRAVAAAIDRLEPALAQVPTASGTLRYEVDWREQSPGFKYNHWELRGVPYRLEIGPRDVAADQGILVRRSDRAKEAIGLAALAGALPGLLSAYQDSLFQRALEFRTAHTHDVDDYATFRSTLEDEGGFLMAHWCGDAACERQINEETGATIRVIPLEGPEDAGRCLIDGVPVPMLRYWPVRRPRPVGRRLDATPPLVTGQRVNHTPFPVARAG